MKPIKLLLLFAIIILFGFSQFYTKTKTVYLVNDKQGKPVKVYENMSESYDYSQRTGCSSQEVKLYFQYDPTDTNGFALRYDQTTKDTYYPVSLTDAQLKKDSIFVVMDKEQPYADRAFLTRVEAEKHATQFKETFLVLPYFVRDEKAIKLAEQLRKKKYKL